MMRAAARATILRGEDMNEIGYGTQSGGAEVVSLTARRPDSAAPALREVRAYWEALRNDRPAPARAEVDPRGIAGALEHAFILERVAPGVGRFRVAGNRLADLAGMALHGMPLFALFAPAARDGLAVTLETVFRHAAPAELPLRGVAGFGRPALDAALLLLPLADAAGRTTMALGALAYDGRIGRSPRRFLLPDTESAARAAAEPCNASAPSCEGHTPPRAGPRLRLVKGGA